MEPFWLIVIGGMLIVISQISTKADRKEQIRLNKHDFIPGDMVRCVDGINKPRNGMFKGWYMEEYAEVVYNCEKWAYYNEYPSELTRREHLKPGWI